MLTGWSSFGLFDSCLARRGVNSNSVHQHGPIRARSLLLSCRGAWCLGQQHWPVDEVLMLTRWWRPQQVEVNRGGLALCDLPDPDTMISSKGALSQRWMDHRKTKRQARGRRIVSLIRCPGLVLLRRMQRRLVTDSQRIVHVGGDAGQRRRSSDAPATRCQASLSKSG